MTCREFVEFLMDYLDDMLSKAEARRFGEHLDECEDCIVYLATYRETIEAGKLVFPPSDSEVPPEVPEDLVTAILDSRLKK